MIEVIKRALPLEAVLSDAGVELRRGKALCPFHGDRSPSFSVKGERWICFAGCGSGDLVDFASKFYGLDTKGAIRLLADRAGLSMQTPAERQAAEKARREREEKARLVTAFRRWEQETVNDISRILRAYHRLRATRKTFSEAELMSLAELQGVVDYLTYIYEEVLCKADDGPKYELFKEDMGYAG